MNGQANGHVRNRVANNGNIKGNVKDDINFMKNKDHQLNEWRRTRRLGFISFVIPVSIILILTTDTFGGVVYSTICSSWGWEPVEKTILYFSLWAFKEVFLNIFKYWLMVHAFAMSKEHYNLIIGKDIDNVFFINKIYFHNSIIPTFLESHDFLNSKCLIIF